MRSRGTDPPALAQGDRTGMTFADDTLAVAQSLGSLLADGSADLDEPALDIALVGRGATLDLARMLYRDVAGTRRHGVGVGVADLEASPVLTLGRLMAQPRRIEAPVSPTDALATRHSGTAARWAMLARDAITATNDWPSGHGAVLQPDDAWGVIADTASIVEAITVLDGDLSGAAGRQGRSHLAAQLMAAHTSGLRSAAAAARSEAALGPLPEQPLDVARAQRPRVVVVRDVDTAVRAQRNVAVLLREARHVRPQHAAQIAIAQARLARALAGGLRSESVGHEKLAAQANALVEPLALAASRPGRVASLTTGDARPLQQASELVRFVCGGTDLLKAARPEQLATWVVHLATSVLALAGRASLELGRREWLVPDTREDAAAMWAPHATGGEVPVLVKATREAATLASTLSTVHLPPMAQRSHHLTLAAHRRLAPALEARRPNRPQLPVGALAPSRRR